MDDFHAPKHIPTQERTQFPESSPNEIQPDYPFSSPVLTSPYPQFNLIPTLSLQQAYHAYHRPNPEPYLVSPTRLFGEPEITLSSYKLHKGGVEKENSWRY